MPLIAKPKPQIGRTNAKFSLDENILSEMKNYAVWAEISLEHFIEEAAKMVFEKDKDWKGVKSASKQKKV